MKINIHYKIEEKNSKKLINQNVSSFDVSEETTCKELKEIIIDNYKAKDFLKVESYSLKHHDNILNDNDVVGKLNSLKFIVLIDDPKELHQIKNK